MSAAPLRQVPLGPAEVALEQRGDGSLRLRSPHALGAHPGNLTSRLALWAGLLRGFLRGTWALGCNFSIPL
jgi:hypothetical protein